MRNQKVLMKLKAIGVALLLWAGCLLAAPTGQPVVIALDAEFGHVTSTSAEAIKRGILIAIDEINQAGGVAGGRPLELVTRDNRSVPSRAIDNVRELAANPNVVAVMSGKFSPVVQELIPVVHELKLPLLAPWSAADDIVDNGRQPNYVFRLSLKDQWAIEALMNSAQRQNIHRIGLMLPNTGWGRSSLKAAERYVEQNKNISLAATAWYNWGEKSLLNQYRNVLQSGAEALLLVANEGEGSILLKEIAALPEAERRPIFSHWGVTGGQFYKLAGDALQKVPFQVVQTYSFIGADDPVAQRVLAALEAKFGMDDPRKIDSPVGIAHAYDLTQLLARAIDKAGGTDRAAIRVALEQLGEYRGLVRVYRPAFTPERHEALGPENIFLARYAPDGALVRIDGGAR